MFPLTLLLNPEILNYSNWILTRKTREAQDAMKKVFWWSYIEIFFIL